MNQSGLLAYRSRPTRIVTAVQIRLDCDALRYRKWGGVQQANAGDWLVDNEGDVYTVDEKTFSATYDSVGPGQYRKHVTVWAEVADHAGDIETREGRTSYSAGDYLVYNDRQRQDGYAVSRERFESLYEPEVY